MGYYYSYLYMHLPLAVQLLSRVDFDLTADAHTKNSAPNGFQSGWTLYHTDNTYPLNS